MPAYTVHVDLLSIAAARTGLKADSRALKQVAYRTVNDTARHVRTKLSRDIRTILPLSKKLVDKHIQLDLANENQQEGISADITIRDRGPISLRNFKPKQTAEGVTVLLDKRKERVLEKGAFGPKIKALHKGVFRRQGKARLPITKIPGPNVYDTVDHEHLDDVAREAARTFMPRRLEQRLKLAFG